MSVDEFRKLLEKLAKLHESEGDSEVANGLRKLAELFDGPQGTVAALVRDIRRARELSDA